MRIANPLLLLKQARESGREGLTLQRRLFAFFIVFLIAVMSAFSLILFSTGVFSAGARESLIYLEGELGHILGSIEKESGTVAVEGVALSEKLAALIERDLPPKGLSRLSGDAERLNTILEAASAPLLAALEKNKVSGAFIVLDATVNPDLPDADYSRAGVFFKNMEPNAINLQSPAIRFLRGPAVIARTLRYDILPQWTMEFAVEDGDFFFTATQTARETDLPVSRLYYWDPVSTLKGDYESTMLLCVPIVGADGTVFGLCGFEVSAMLFKLQNSPDNSTHTRAFAMLAPITGDTLIAADAMFAGSYAAMSSGMSDMLTFSSADHGFYEYADASGKRYTGLHQIVRLYPKNSAFEDRQWALAVMLPQEDLAAYMLEQNRGILVLLMALLLFSLGIAFIISRRYIAPVVKAIDKVKSGVLNYEKTHIQEIDDLLAFLAERDTEEDEDRPGKGTDRASLYEAFVRNIKTLSPAERAVFNLYLEGYDAKRIAEILCLSINTIKTHNRRIFQKLEVSSRKELLVYVSMMKERGGVPGDA